MTRRTKLRWKQCIVELQEESCWLSIVECREVEVSKDDMEK